MLQKVNSKYRIASTFIKVKCTKFSRQFLFFPPNSRNFYMLNDKMVTQVDGNLSYTCY